MGSSKSDMEVGRQQEKSKELTNVPMCPYPKRSKNRRQCIEAANIMDRMIGREQNGGLCALETPQHDVHILATESVESRMELYPPGTPAPLLSSTPCEAGCHCY